MLTMLWLRYVPTMQRHLPLVFPGTALQPQGMLGTNAHAGGIGSQPCYRHGPAHFDMKQLLDANYERFPAFHVFKGMNDEDESYLDR